MYFVPDPKRPRYFWEMLSGRSWQYICSGINMATPQLNYGFHTTCQNTCWRLQRFGWKSCLLSPEVEGTECILSLRCQLKNEKVGRCQCAWRHSKEVIADIAPLAVFPYPAPAHKGRRAQVLIFWRKRGELGSNSCQEHLWLSRFSVGTVVHTRKFSTF